MTPKMASKSTLTGFLFMSTDFLTIKKKILSSSEAKWAKSSLSEVVSATDMMPYFLHLTLKKTPFGRDSADLEDIHPVLQNTLDSIPDDYKTPTLFQNISQKKITVLKFSLKLFDTIAPKISINHQLQLTQKILRIMDALIFNGYSILIEVINDNPEFRTQFSSILTKEIYGFFNYTTTEPLKFNLDLDLRLFSYPLFYSDTEALLKLNFPKKPLTKGFEIFRLESFNPLEELLSILNQIHRTIGIELVIILYNEQFQHAFAREAFYQGFVEFIKTHPFKTLFHLLLVHKKVEDQRLSNLLSAGEDNKEGVFRSLNGNSGYYIDSEELFALSHQRRLMPCYLPELSSSEEQPLSTVLAIPSYFYSKEITPEVRPSKQTGPQKVTTSYAFSLSQEQETTQEQQQILQQEQQQLTTQELTQSATQHQEVNQSYRSWPKPFLRIEAFAENIRTCAQIQLKEAQEQEKKWGLFRTSFYYEHCNQETFWQNLVYNESAKMEFAAKTFGMVFLKKRRTHSTHFFTLLLY